MIDTQQIDRIEGSTAYDPTGEKVGRVGQLYLDDQTGRPSWVTVSTGLLGTGETFVPLEGATFDGQDLRLAYSKDTIKNAPSEGADEHLDYAQEQALHRYYGLGGTSTETQAGVGTETNVEPGTQSGTQTAQAGTQTGLTGTATGDEAAVTLSEERLEVGTVERESGRVRLRKYIVTENETITVPVRKEKLVVERLPAAGTVTDPITGADGAAEVIEEVTLREERVIVEKETVAVEQVRVGKQQVTEEQEITAQVRRERADVEIDGRPVQQ